jgi:hypothetical protein
LFPATSVDVREYVFDPAVSTASAATAALRRPYVVPPIGNEPDASARAVCAADRELTFAVIVDTPLAGFPVSLTLA